MRMVEPARMSSGFDKWFTAANAGNCAASPSSRSAIPLNVSPGATGTSRSPEVSGRAEGAAVRASAGSCRIHPGRGKLFAVRLPPSGCGLPTLSAMISPVRSPEPNVFSAIDQVDSPGCTV